MSVKQKTTPPPSLFLRDNILKWKLHASFTRYDLQKLVRYSHLIVYFLFLFAFTSRYHFHKFLELHSILSLKRFSSQIFFFNRFTQPPAPLTRGFSWSQWPAIFTNHWTRNGLKVTGNKSITIIYFFLSEIIFCERMISLSNNDRFDDKIFLRNIWHFSVITRINYISIFFLFILKIHERTSM